MTCSRPSKVRIEQQVEGDVLTEHAPQDVIHVFQNRVEFQNRRLEDLIPAIREKLIGKPCAALGCFPNLVDARSSNLGRLIALQQKFGMAQNDGQEIIKIVGDAACELADRLHPADLLRDAVCRRGDFLAEPLHGFYSTLAFRLLLVFLLLPAGTKTAGQ